LENELEKWPSMYIPHDSDKPEPETVIGFWHTGGGLVMNEIERGKSTPTKCDFCKAWSRHTWYSKYGVIHACNYHWDRLSLVDVNTDKHWKQIKRRVG